MGLDNCNRCGHPLKAHCKGGVNHGNYKEDARMIPMEYRSATSPCKTKHCNEPLCSCVEHQPATE